MPFMRLHSSAGKHYLSGTIGLAIVRSVKITWGGQVREESLHLSPNEYQQEQN
jgi:hypothetical protein